MTRVYNVRQRRGSWLTDWLSDNGDNNKKPDCNTIVDKQNKHKIWIYNQKLLSSFLGTGWMWSHFRWNWPVSLIKTFSTNGMVTTVEHLIRSQTSKSDLTILIKTIITVTDWLGHLSINATWFQWLTGQRLNLFGDLEIIPWNRFIELTRDSLNYITWRGDCDTGWVF